MAAARAGTTHVSSARDTNMTSVQSVSPTVTVLVSSKPTPLMVTVAPPVVPTLDGDTALTERTTCAATGDYSQ